MSKLPIVERLRVYSSYQHYKPGRAELRELFDDAATTITELVSALEKARNVLHDALMPDGIYPQDAEPVIAEIDTLLSNTRGDTKNDKG